MKIQIRKSAIRDLKNLNNPIKKQIEDKILELKNFPNISNIKKLTNFEPAYRVRIGDYRVLFDVIGDDIFIGRVLHRKEAYE
ncbi:MAG: type II toxin-antitoxin system RelE/ParE family toxin [Campylobacterales bacterium]|nr:type II toxin-antitoxin system RelE/ParE family toxin [Campylobacterales bacterium]